MTQKRTDLARMAGLKLDNAMRSAATPGRFGQAAAALPDRKAQRREDAAAGLVPFACKLPQTLAEALRARSAQHPEGLNGLVAELLQAGLK